MFLAITQRSSPQIQLHFFLRILILMRFPKIIFMLLPAFLQKSLEINILQSLQNSSSQQIFKYSNISIKFVKKYVQLFLHSFLEQLVQGFLQKVILLLTSQNSSEKILRDSSKYSPEIFFCFFKQHKHSSRILLKKFFSRFTQGFCISFLNFSLNLSRISISQTLRLYKLLYIFSG